MHAQYALSNRIVGNSCGRLALGGDGGNDNWAAENTANISVAGAASPTRMLIQGGSRLLMI